MDLKEFFADNSISIDIISNFDMWKEGKCTKSECISESKRIIKEYKGEEGETLIAEMAFYWCLLNSNVFDAKLKTKLEAYSLQDIRKLYHEDASAIYEVLVSLLKEEPKALVKKKITYSKMRWKPGDVYAIQMPPDIKLSCNFNQDTSVYVLINCERIVEETSRNQEITAYILLHFGELEADLSEVISCSAALPSRRPNNDKDVFLYKYYFFDITHNCPEEQLRYLGNYKNIGSELENELVTDNYMFFGWITWNTLFRDVEHHYSLFKDYLKR